MTTEDALKYGIKQLLPAAANRQNLAALDAEVLLSFVIGKPREQLLIHPETKLSARQFKKFSSFIARRSRHEPIAHITGKKDFLGIDFAVNKNTLIPRPETEMLVEEAIREFQITNLAYRQAGSKLQILDIGTGSGAIAVALAKNLPKAKIIATDTSPAALRVAKQNAKIHGVADRIKFIKTSLLPLNLNSKLLTLVVANLPYLPTRVWNRAMPDVKKFEPKSALLGGADGLNLIRKLLQEIKSKNIKGAVLLEIDPSQPKKLSSFTKKLFPRAIMETKKDLAGLSRMVKIILI